MNEITTVSPTIYVRVWLNVTNPISTEKLVLIHQTSDEVQSLLQRVMHRLLTHTAMI